MLIGNQAESSMERTRHVKTKTIQKHIDGHILHAVYDTHTDSSIINAICPLKECQRTEQQPNRHRICYKMKNAFRGYCITTIAGTM